MIIYSLVRTNNSLRLPRLSISSHRSTNSTLPTSLHLGQGRSDPTGIHSQFPFFSSYILYVLAINGSASAKGSHGRENAISEVSKLGLDKRRVAKLIVNISLVMVPL